MRYFVIYLAAINILTFCVYGADKRRAKIQGARRVPEKTLFALALLLGRTNVRANSKERNFFM